MTIRVLSVLETSSDDLWYHCDIASVMAEMVRNAFCVVLLTPCHTVKKKTPIHILCIPIQDILNKLRRKDEPETSLLITSSTQIFLIYPLPETAVYSPLSLPLVPAFPPPPPPPLGAAPPRLVSLTFFAAAQPSNPVVPSIKAQTIISSFRLSRWIQVERTSPTLPPPVPPPPLLPLPSDSGEDEEPLSLMSLQMGRFCDRQKAWVHWAQEAWALSWIRVLFLKQVHLQNRGAAVLLLLLLLVLLIVVRRGG